MAAPSPSDILADPPALNAAAQTWPFVVDPFPGPALLRGYLGAPKVAGAGVILVPTRDVLIHER